MAEGQEYRLDFFAKSCSLYGSSSSYRGTFWRSVRNGFRWKQYDLHSAIGQLGLVLRASCVCGIQVARLSEKGRSPAVLSHRRYVLARFPDLAIPLVSVAPPLNLTTPGSPPLRRPL